MAEFESVLKASEVAPGEMKQVAVGGTDVVVANVDGKFCAFGSLCPHEDAPLCEGELDGDVVTCPWHGWQYLPGNGTSPPPFEEKVETHRTVVRDDTVWVDPEPLPPGTPQSGATP